MTKVVVQEDLFDVIEALNRRIKYLEDSLRGGSTTAPIDYQIVHGTNPGDRATVTAAGTHPLFRDLGTNRLEISFTPPVNVWWEVSVSALWFTKLAPATVPGRLELILLVTPTPTTGLGFAAGPSATQRSDSTPSFGRSVSYPFALNAGVAYTVQAMYFTSGAAYSYYQDTGYLWMAAKAIARA